MSTTPMEEEAVEGSTKTTTKNSCAPTANANANESKQIKWNIRPMRQEDIEKCLQIWSQVELTEGRQTVSSVLAADPLGFYVAELIEDEDDTRKKKQVIGMCAGPMTRNDTAFMGFYAVEPKYQGIGIGRELWSKTIGRLERSINVGLYGVPSMSEKYKKSGFTIEDTTRMLIYESEREGERERNVNEQLNLSALKDLNDLTGTGTLGDGCRLEILNDNGDEESELLFKKLVDYDHSVQRFFREKLLRLYLTGEDVPLTFVIVRDYNNKTSDLKEAAQIKQPSTQSYAIQPQSKQESTIIEDETLSKTTKCSLTLGANETSSGSAPAKSDYEILGYGCIRMDNNSGGMIGPIYADSSDLCEILLKNLILNFKLEEGHIYSVMALSSNKQACNILTKLGLKEMEQCSRMFTKFVPAASFSKIYYVHSPNFTLF